MRLFILFGLVGGLLMALCQWLVFVYAPLEQSMGVVQKIFYMHLPVAWWCFVSFFVACVTGALWLKTRRPRWDALSAARCGNGHGLGHAGFNYRFHLGAPLLGNLVDLGSSSDYHAGAVVHLCRLPRAALHASASGQTLSCARSWPLSGSLTCAGLSLRPSVAIHTSGCFCLGRRRHGQPHGRCGHCLRSLFRTDMAGAARPSLPADAAGGTTGQTCARRRRDRRLIPAFPLPRTKYCGNLSRTIPNFKHPAGDIHGSDTLAHGGKRRALDWAWPLYFLSDLKTTCAGSHYTYIYYAGGRR